MWEIEIQKENWGGGGGGGDNHAYQVSQGYQLCS